MMKRVLIIFTIGLFFWNCSDKGLDTFNAPSSDVFFDNPIGTRFVDTIRFGFGLTNVSDTVLYIGVKISGDTAAYDRPVNFEVAYTDVAVEGVDFDLEKECVIPAGEITARIPIKLYRTLDDEDKDFRIVALKLKENEYFTTNVKSRYHYYDQESPRREVNVLNLTVEFTSEVGEPRTWGTYFGYFSPAKFMSVNEACNLEPTSWNDFPGTNIPIDKVGVWPVMYENYLIMMIKLGEEYAIKDPSSKSYYGYATIKGAAGTDKVSDALEEAEWFNKGE